MSLFKPNQQFLIMNKLSLFILGFVLLRYSLFAQVSINTDNSTPDNSAMLDVKSTNKGFLPPRVALTAINSALPITAPAIGLFVYNTSVTGTPPNNVIPGYYCWNGIKWIPVVAPQGTNVGDMLYWNGTQWINVPAGSNWQVLTFINGVPTWKQPSLPCGVSVTVNHLAGAIAPVTKTVTYGTVTNISGEPSKCWITSNLGSDHQATLIFDGSESAAGWYWQFNRKQGYKLDDDGTTRTPGTTWITSISESFDWLSANDPCILELGSGWRIPTNTEWTNVDAVGNWTNWNGPWNSGLKLHSAGRLSNTDGSLSDRGSFGFYWSCTQNDASNGWALGFNSGISQMYSNGTKAFGFTLRCLRDL